MCSSLRAPTSSRAEEAALRKAGTLGNLPSAAHTSGATRVLLPAIYTKAEKVRCYAFDDHVTANCLHFTGSSSHLVNLATTSGNQPPAYFTIVGLAARPVPAGSWSVYVMRLASALLAAALVASAFACLERSRRHELAALGLLVALTPMALFLGGVVNPNGVEIAAGIGVWAAGIVLVRDATDHVDRRLVGRLVIATLALTLARALGPLWVALIGLSLLAIASRGRIRVLARDRAVRVGALVVVLAALIQGVWDETRGALAEQNSPPPQAHAAISVIVRYSFGLSFDRFKQMIGTFGWLDTPAPAVTYLIWFIALGLVVLAAIAFAQRRLRNVTLGVLVLAIVVPVVLEVSRARTSGFIWQGRYTLPFAVGVPILAGFAAAATIGRSEVSAPLRRVLVWTCSALVLAQLLAFVQTLRRYMVGYDSGLLFFRHAAWNPPAPALLLIAVFGIAYVGLLGWLFTLRGSPHDDGSQRADAAAGVA